jgi:hypothetical protein
MGKKRHNRKKQVAKSIFWLDNYHLDYLSELLALAHIVKNRPLTNLNSRI